jgi:hypothetical protein
MFAQGMDAGVGRLGAAARNNQRALDLPAKNATEILADGLTGPEFVLHFPDVGFE